MCQPLSSRSGQVCLASSDLLHMHLARVGIIIIVGRPTPGGIGHMEPTSCFHPTQRRAYMLRDAHQHVHQCGIYSSVASKMSFRLSTLSFEGANGGEAHRERSEWWVDPTRFMLMCRMRGQQGCSSGWQVKQNGRSLSF